MRRFLATIGLGLLGACASITCAGAPEWAVAVFPSGAEFSLEIAADPPTRRLGYMFRERLDPREGMLFLFDTSERHSIWMKNCKVSLDIIWLDERMTVVDVFHSARPCPEAGPCPSMAPLRAARYVLEVAGGTVERQGLEVGQRLVVLSEPALP